MEARPTDMPTLQACAACGQAWLTEVYADVFAERKVPAAQVLLTRNDVFHRDAYLNARNTIVRLLELGAVPIVNENDTVSVDEVSFGDNDMLGAIVATMVDAERYVILSDIDGLYDKNPATHDDAKFIERVEAIDPATMAMASGAGSAIGTGGMTTKLNAARALLAAGIPMTICKGRSDEPVLHAVRRDGRRTEFESDGTQREAARKLWVGLAGKPRGRVTVDAGAARALRREGASLLPVGVVAVEGTFSKGDVVDVVDGDGVLIGRGMVAYDADTLSRVRGLRSDVIGRFLPEMADLPAIHRDELFVF
jgi:glutamate 5-kinase